ncbi:MULTISPECIES: uroporphyrinogen-III C-methyltransferase [unclassified Janibacter]|uniref:uroporphyrinogen-III C-methyltransferase n=1 Tax=unclassified Janibacter TaxID=2649294 RepID=UPI003D0954EC
MSLTLPGTPRSALVRDPGPQAHVTIHALVDAGVEVTVAAAAPDPSLVDLASRGLITLTADADTDAFDLVLRDTREPSSAPAASTGEVVLVGGGPGAPGLMTLDGLAALEAADVIVYDRLAPLGLLERARADALLVPVGKIPRGAFTPQERINQVLVEHALVGRRVVRLKGGDNFVFGRGGEEWNACVSAGIPVRVVPGVTSSVAVPALAGIPVTHRQLTPGFVVVTGHVGPDDERNTVDWDALAGLGLTLVILMGVGTLESIVTRLIAAGMDPATPAASVADGGLPTQRVARATLATLPAAADAADVSAPAVTVIGPSVAALDQPDGRS